MKFNKIILLFLLAGIFILLLIYPFKNTQSNVIISQNFKKIDVIIIDAGHGGKDPGTVGLSGVYEKNIVLQIALKLRKLINKNYDDVKVVLTRDKDEFIELKNRGKIANNNEGKLFISIHCNSKKPEEADKNGYEIYLLDLGRLNEALAITTTENKIFSFRNDSLNRDNSIVSSLIESSFMKNGERFAGILQTEMGLNTKLESRGVLQAGFYVLLGASMPTVLVECGYLSNKNDEDYLNSNRGQEDIAKGIYKAIRLYKFDYEYENKF